MSASGAFGHLRPISDDFSCGRPVDFPSTYTDFLKSFIQETLFLPSPNGGETANLRPRDPLQGGGGGKVEKGTKEEPGLCLCLHLCQPPRPCSPSTADKLLSCNPGAFCLYVRVSRRASSTKLCPCLPRLAGELLTCRPAMLFGWAA